MLLKAALCCFSLAIATVPAQEGLSFVEKAALSGGASVTSSAIHGNFAFVGDSGALGTGAVYVFERSPSGWSSAEPIAVLTASNGGANHLFGSALAVDGDTLVVAAPQGGGSGPGWGALYVFEKPSSGWASSTETARLWRLSPTPWFDPTWSQWITWDDLGQSVAIHGGTIVATAQQASPTGGVFVFARSGSSWVDMTETAELSESDNRWVGNSVAVHDETVVLGSTALSGFRGGVLVYERPAQGWSDMTETARLSVSDQESSLAGKGHEALAFDGTTIAVGATDARIGGALGTGAVYVFERPLSGWSDANETARLAARNPSALDYLGRAVDVQGNRVVAGTSARGGTALVFERTGTGWSNASEVATLASSNGDPVGSSLDFGGEAVITSSPLSAAAFVFAQPAVMLGSGCGATPLGVAGSTRLGTTLLVSNQGCGRAPSHGPTPAAAVVIGAAATTPIPLTSSAACGTDRLCQLMCAPVAIAGGPQHRFAVEADPALVGIEVCLQGVCIDLPCVRTTDVVTVTISQ